MDVFADRIAIVTGGASGIGLALSRELSRRGARVILADIDGARAEAAAGAIPGATARGAQVDVTDGAAMERLVAEVVAAHGRIDYLFNNAGIFIVGEVRHMSLADWGRIVDVNLRGVVHGVAAAYPQMIRQGSGHIVNTASLAGITATPGATAYAATKHAVVGLSTGLRCEAAGLGVRVSVVCPGLIDTPIKDAALYLRTDRDTILASLPVALYPADRCARDILQGVERNRAIIVITRSARVAWWFYRFAPGLYLRMARRFGEQSPLLNRSPEGR